MTTPSLQLQLIYEREPKREGEQLRQVRELMADGKWRTLGDIQKQLPQHYETQSISARLRDLRKPEHGSHTVNRSKVGTGLFQYQVIGRTQ